jgi:hypothetical protein
VLLQTGAAYVSTEWINSLYRVILLGMDNIESRSRRGKSWRKMPMALCLHVCLSVHPCATAQLSLDRVS